jgi:predicted dehydrogenase
MRTVGIALVGTGFALRTQLPALSFVEGAAVRALVGHEPARTAELARQHGIPFATHRLDEVLRRDEIDLVCIATPPHLHRPMCEAALAADKHVLCEKPLALDAAEAQSMVEVARTTTRLAVVDHQLRFAPSVRKLRRLIGDGYIGTPYHAHVTMMRRRWIDAHQQHTWWHDAAQGGGVLGALGSHAIDWLRWTFGDIEWARGDLQTFVRERPVHGEVRPRTVDADEYAAVQLHLPRDVRATLTLSVVAHRGPALQFEVYGAEGMLLFDSEGRLWGSRCDSAGTGSQSPLEELSEPEELAQDVLRAIPDSPWARAFLHFARRLVPAAAGELPLDEAADFEAGLAVQRVLDAVRATSPGHGTGG